MSGHVATSVVLSSGDTAYVRPIEPADAPLLLAFHERQPAENLYRRFFSPKRTLSVEELAHFTTVDHHDRVALVMELHGEFIAWASYERWRGRDDADVAFMVDAAQQGKGIATLLLEHLAAIARSNGIARFTAEVLADNRSMLSVFARAGWPVRRRFDSGVIELDFPLGDTEAFVESVEQREQRSDSRAVARLLLPRSIAVIGATDREGSLGRHLWTNVTSSFRGPVFAVNPSRSVVLGAPCVPRVTDIEADVWLAIIAVPPDQLVATIDDCLAKRVRGAVIATAIDGTGIDVDDLVERSRRYGMRIIGPASMGIAGGGEDRPELEASLAPLGFVPGRVAMSMQSGSLGASVLQLAIRLSLGLSWFVSLGDKCDVSGNDLLQFWEDDEQTTVIAMYTETLGNPRKFARIARRVSRRRPIISVRTGPAASSVAADALYEQSGLIQVPTVRAMLDAARVLATQPVPLGPRVAVLTNSRSPGVLATAALETAGLVVVPAPHPLSWRSSDADYEVAVRAALDDDGVDAVVVIHVPPLLSAPTPDEAIGAAAAGSTKPVLAIVLGHADGPLCAGSPVPSFAFPEPAAAVLGHMYRYRRWLDAEASGPAPALTDVDPDRVTELLAGVMEDGGGTLAWSTAAQVLSAYGIPVADGLEVVGDDGAIVDAAAALGYPVAVKAFTRSVGRSAEAGVALDLADSHAVVEAVHVMRQHLGAAAEHLLVQKMLHPGIEVRLQCRTDPDLGPVVLVGLGGRDAESIGDHAGRLPPLSVSAAASLVASTRAGSALLAADIDPAPLVDVVVRLGRLVADHAEIGDIDVNPLMVATDGCAVADVSMHVAPVDASPAALRRLG